MVRRITTEAGIPGIHLCTLNLEKSVTRVLEILQWTPAHAAAAAATHPAHHVRHGAEVGHAAAARCVRDSGGGRGGLLGNACLGVLEAGLEACIRWVELEAALEGVGGLLEVAQAELCVAAWRSVPLRRSSTQHTHPSL